MTCCAKRSAVCSSVPAYPFTSVPMSQMSPLPPPLFPLLPCFHVPNVPKHSSSQSRLRLQEMEKEMEMETVTAISMSRGGAWGSGWTVTQITNWIRSVSCLSLSLSLSGSNLPCSHNLVALSSLTLLCSAHYQAALCCPIARVWTSTQTDRERGRGGDCRTHTQTFIWFIILPNNWHYHFAGDRLYLH